MPSTATKDVLRARRKLLLRDSFVFLILALVTVALFIVTLVLFRSFSSHRVELAQRWYARGQRDLANHDPNQAVLDLRTALGYAPSEHNYQMLLAEALSQAGKTDEAFAYFSNLWEAQPGDGMLNVQLARLSAHKRDVAAAVHYYRSAIYGTWEGDGVTRRREARLELIRYLIAQKDLGTARTELLIASGNAPSDPAVQLELASLMQQAGDPASALHLYQAILALQPHNTEALTAGGTTAFHMGHFATAHRLLEEAVRRQPALEHDPATQDILTRTRSILDLDPSPHLPPGTRVAHILALRNLAHQRFNACKAQLANSPQVSSLQSLDARWSSEPAHVTSASLLQNPDRQQGELDLIYATEIAARDLCGPPTGSDASVLLMALSPENIEQ